MEDSQSNLQSTYSLLDSGNGRKLERFGPYSLSRPCAQAVWLPHLPEGKWNQADASFSREPANKWIYNHTLPASWTVNVADILFKIAPTDFGHLGIFPEQGEFWLWVQETIRKAISNGRRNIQVLNLFAYSGGMTLAAAKAGAHVCHLDASKGMVDWARENAALNHLESAPVRWIVDDVGKFLKRELRRDKRYDAIILDPPSFGRGSRGEVFKIEEDLHPLLADCKALLSDNPLFILLSCHTAGFTPLVMRHVMAQLMQGKKGKIDSGEMVLSGDSHILSIPSGSYARWQEG